MKITIEEFAKKYNVSTEKVKEFLRFCKIDPNDEFQKVSEENLKMFLPTMK